MYQAILHRWTSTSEDAAAISRFDNAGVNTQNGQPGQVNGSWICSLYEGYYLRRNVIYLSSHSKSFSTQAFRFQIGSVSPSHPSVGTRSTGKP